MKVTIENKKGLNKDLKVFVDKKTMSTYIDQKYEEIKGTVNLKGFRPGKVPREILKRQFGKAVFNEVLDKVLKDTSTKALTENKIKPAGQPKLDLKTYGEDKDLEYIISVTELPKVEIKSIENIKFDDYSVKIDDSETDKRLEEIAKNQPNFKDASEAYKAKDGDLIAFDYSATVDAKPFKGGEGKNTQLTLGKDLFLKGFDNQLVNLKKKEKKKVKSTLPPNHPKKELASKEAIFDCEIINIKSSIKNKLDDNFAKKLGAKDLSDLTEKVKNQITNQYDMALNSILKKEILDQIDKNYKIDIPKNLIDNELKSTPNDPNSKNKESTMSAEKRIKLGLILNEYGEKNDIKVTQEELKNEIQKQVKSMPGQEKLVFDYYQKNPSATQHLQSTIYEDKIIKFIKTKANLSKKELKIKEAEKIIMKSNEKYKAKTTTQLKKKKSNPKK